VDLEETYPPSGNWYSNWSCN